MSSFNPPTRGSELFRCHRVPKKGEPTMTMRLWISLASLLLTAVTASALLASPGDAQAGKTVYDSKCNTCHGADGEGNAALAKTLKVTFKDLKSKEVQSKSDTDIKKQIVDGYQKMAPVKGLADKQLDDVIAFVRSLAKS